MSFTNSRWKDTLLSALTFDVMFMVSSITTYQKCWDFYNASTSKNWW